MRPSECPTLLVLDTTASGHKAEGVQTFSVLMLKMDFLGERVKNSCISLNESW